MEENSHPWHQRSKKRGRSNNDESVVDAPQRSIRRRSLRPHADRSEFQRQLQHFQSPTEESNCVVRTQSSIGSSFQHNPQPPRQNRKMSSLYDMLSPVDVFAGRGKGAYLHEGNRRLALLITEYLPAYQKATSNKEKVAITTFIVNSVKQRGGRFMKEDTSSYNCTELRLVELCDRKARVKVSQVRTDNPSICVQCLCASTSSILTFSFLHLVSCSCSLLCLGPHQPGNAAQKTTCRRSRSEYL